MTEPESRVEEGGDPACWVGRVCPDCGRFTEREAPPVCPHCGSALPDE